MIHRIHIKLASGAVPARAFLLAAWFGTAAILVAWAAGASAQAPSEPTATAAQQGFPAPAAGAGNAGVGVAPPVAPALGATSAPPPSYAPGTTAQQLAQQMQQAQGGALPSPPPPVSLNQMAAAPGGAASSATVAPNPFAPSPTPAADPALQAGGQPAAGVPPAAYAPVTGEPVNPGVPGTAPTALPPLPPPSVASQVPRVVDDYLGMTPGDIRDLRRTLEDRQRAASELPNPPKAVTGSITVSLSPGATPPVIRTYQGSVSSFVVVDASGAPWPVENFLVGSKLFSVSRLDQGQGSTFAIETMGMYGQSNLVLKLAGVSTPAVLTLMAGQRELDGRTEVRIQGRGPNATVATASLPEGTDARLLPVLDGVPPEGGTPLIVTGLDQVKAWLMPNRKMIVRTPVRIFKPATLQFVSSSDGTYVYVFPATPRLLGIANGAFVDIGVSGW